VKAKEPRKNRGSFFDRVDVFDFRQHRRRITDSSTFFAEATNGEP
jgi:hypothetical protein